MIFQPNLFVLLLFTVMGMVLGWLLNANERRNYDRYVWERDIAQAISVANSGSDRA